MSDIPDALRYTAEHEYIRETDEERVVVIGVTDYAQGELGDVVYIELPSAGDEFSHMEPFGTIEAVKTVSELFSPAAGEIIEVNDQLEADPSLVNSDPYGEGWMVRMRLKPGSEMDELLTAAEYRSVIGDDA